MATSKYKNNAKRTPFGRKVYDAPVEWQELLRSAIDEPGKLSEAYAMFYQYSIGNSMMALWQLSARGLPVGPLASYARWQELGRQVRKGETALLMSCPRTFKATTTDENGNDAVEHRVTFVFKPTCFAYAQTDPIDGQEDRSDKLRDVVADWNRDAALAALNVTLAPFDDVNGNFQGYFQPKDRTIRINPMAVAPEKTLLHELAHSVLHPNGHDATVSRGICEFEAEAVALIVSTVLGVARPEESRGYCQHWLAETGADDISEQTARRIFSTAQKILAAGRPAASQPAGETAGDDSAVAA